VVSSAPKNLRLKGAIICDSVLRLMRLATDAGDGDLEAYMVYLAVVSSGVGHIMRDPALRKRFAVEPVPDDLRPTVSRRAIAESVGLPRETVRRKIGALIEAGHLVARPGGVVIVGPALEKNLHFVLESIREFERVSAELARSDEV
jgi:hypothetical protein